MAYRLSLQYSTTNSVTQWKHCTIQLMSDISVSLFCPFVYRYIGYTISTVNSVSLLRPTICVMSASHWTIRSSFSNWRGKMKIVRAAFLLFILISTKTIDRKGSYVLILVCLLVAGLFVCLHNYCKNCR